MPGRSDFTEQEWEALHKGVTGAGLLVTASDRGFYDTFKEAGALAKHLAGARQNASSAVVRELAQERGTGFGFGSSPDELSSRLSSRCVPPSRCLSRRHRTRSMSIASSSSRSPSPSRMSRAAARPPSRTCSRNSGLRSTALRQPKPAQRLPAWGTLKVRSGRRTLSSAASQPNAFPGRRRAGVLQPEDRRGVPPGAVRGGLRAALRAAGVGGYVRPFHDLRHTAITNDAASAASPIAVMAKAGHSSMATTKRYLHLA